MVVLVTQQSILSPRQVCPGCVLATAQGLPRFQGGRLSCGFQGSAAQASNIAPEAASQNCPMGFRVVQVPA